jgi:hypothetical protein
MSHPYAQLLAISETRCARQPCAGLSTSLPSIDALGGRIDSEVSAVGKGALNLEAWKGR